MLLTTVTFPRRLVHLANEVSCGLPRVSLRTPLGVLRPNFAHVSEITLISGRFEDKFPRNL